MATSALVKLEREKRKTDREKWTRDLLRESILTPNMMRLAMIAGIIAYATAEARQPENPGPVRTALAYALPGIGIPLIAADAGIKDRWALGAISAVSVGYVTGQIQAGWGEGGLLPQVPGNISIWEWLRDFFQNPYGGGMV